MADGWRADDSFCIAGSAVLEKGSFTFDREVDGAIPERLGGWNG